MTTKTSVYDRFPVTSDELVADIEAAKCDLNDLLKLISDLAMTAPDAGGPGNEETIVIRKAGLQGLEGVASRILWGVMSDRLGELQARLREQEERNGIPSEAVRNRKIIDAAYDITKRHSC